MEKVPVNWEELCKEKDIRIRHFRKLDKVITPRPSESKPTETWRNGRLYATLIADRQPDANDRIFFGMCVVSPKDTGSIEKGREIAYKRYKLAKAGQVGNNRYCSILTLDVLLYGALFTSNFIAKIKDIKSVA